MDGTCGVSEDTPVTKLTEYIKSEDGLSSKKKKTRSIAQVFFIWLKLWSYGTSYIFTFWKEQCGMQTNKLSGKVWQNLAMSCHYVLFQNVEVYE